MFQAEDTAELRAGLWDGVGPWGNCRVSLCLWQQV